MLWAYLTREDNQPPSFNSLLEMTDLSDLSSIIFIDFPKQAARPDMIPPPCRTSERRICVRTAPPRIRARLRERAAAAAAATWWIINAAVCLRVSFHASFSSSSSAAAAEPTLARR